MNPAILYPAFYLVALTFWIGIRLAAGRMRAVKNMQVSPGFYVLQNTDKEPDKLRQLSRNYSNLFELPMIFYVLVVVVAITQTTDTALLVLCWLFVASRTLHCVIHTGANRLMSRMLAFLAGVAILLLAWVYLVIKLAVLGRLF